MLSSCRPLNALVGSDTQCMSEAPTRRLILIALLLGAVGGCNLVRDATTRLPGPRMYEKGAAVIEGIRAFEQRIGFQPTDNFLNPTRETESYPFCGFASRLVLPYTYEDPSIHWQSSTATESDCRQLAGEGMDVYFGQSEAIGEIGAPVTPSMLAGSLVRFVYLVIHEDCHDQYDFPRGIEEALCNVIAYNAMVEYATENERPGFLERTAMRRYAERESERTRAAKALYEELERLYARFGRKEISAQALMDERAKVFGRVEKALALERGSVTNVRIANEMTYSRHFPFLESVFKAHDRDLARTVFFFRRVDALKPSRASILKQLRLKSEESLEFIRAHEAAVLETIRKELDAAKLRLP